MDSKDNNPPRNWRIHMAAIGIGIFAFLWSVILPDGYAWGDASQHRPQLWFSPLFFTTVPSLLAGDFGLPLLFWASSKYLW
jgi:hypothetical protein